MFVHIQKQLFVFFLPYFVYNTLEHAVANSKHIGIDRTSTSNH